MTDMFSPSKRSVIMSRIKSTETSPELIVRGLFKSLGLRFQTYKKSLPGKPDLVFLKHKTVVFVHGCFWHQHPGCSRNFTPKSNKNYWVPKLERNKIRFREVQKLLRKSGWKVIVIWECQTKNPKRVLHVAKKFSSKGLVN